VYFEGSPLAKNFKALCQGVPLTLYVPMFPLKYLCPTKQERSKEIKRKLFTKKEVFAFT
jgi:hypothetical protein